MAEPLLGNVGERLVYRERIESGVEYIHALVHDGVMQARRNLLSRTGQNNRRLLGFRVEPDTEHIS